LAWIVAGGRWMDDSIVRVVDFFRDARIFLVDFSWSFSFSEVIAGWIFDLNCCWWTLDG
jgi:hypothetical protein